MLGGSGGCHWWEQNYDYQHGEQNQNNQICQCCDETFLSNRHNSDILKQMSRPIAELSLSLAYGHSQ